MKQSDIKRFIDFFCDAALRVRKQKPTIIRGKDGKLVKQALEVFSWQKLELLSGTFLAKKKKLPTSMGAMLASGVLEELSRKMRAPSFWHDLDILSDRYFPRAFDALPNKKIILRGAPREWQ